MSSSRYSDVIASTDWSTLVHAYGSAQDIPRLWATFLQDGDPEGDFANTICHQGSVYSSTRALVPALMDLAKSDHETSKDALGVLGWIMRSPDKQPPWVAQMKTEIEDELNLWLRIASEPSERAHQALYLLTSIAMHSGNDDAASAVRAAAEKAIASERDKLHTLVEELEGTHF